MHEKSFTGKFRKPDLFENNFNPLSVNSKNGQAFYEVRRMISSKKKSINIRGTSIKRQMYPDKKIYWQRVKNKLGFLQKENNLIDDKMLKKLRYLYKLRAKNLYLTSVIQQNIAMKTILSSLNDILRSPLAVGKTRYVEGSSQHAYNLPTYTFNNLENDLMKVIINQILSDSNGKCLIPTQLKQNVLSATSFTSEATRDFLSRLEEDSLEKRELQSKVTD